MPGAGHPGLGPDFRDLMSSTARENALQEPDVRLGARMSGLMARMSGLWPRCPARRFQIGIWLRCSIWGLEIDDFRGKIVEISWMESGENWRDARSTRNQANPWIKINKTSSNQQITKKIGGYFWWGIFEIGTKSTKLG